MFKSHIVLSKAVSSLHLHQHKKIRLTNQKERKWAAVNPIWINKGDESQKYHKVFKNVQSVFGESKRRSK